MAVAAIADDQRHMRHALQLAGRGLGRVAPNPSVGCVIVKDGKVIGAALTANGGRPHAETLAIHAAGDDARGATLYVTLEPCAHHGQTPPCTDAIIAAGIARVVAGPADPDPRVSGKGFAQLRQAGIDVVIHVEDQASADLNVGFFSRQRRGLPWVSAKLATSADGKVALPGGASQWLTAEQSRMTGHRLRGLNDAVLTGIDTVLADDPQFTCRLPGLIHRTPVRVVADSRLRLPQDSLLVKTARTHAVWVLCREDMLEKSREKVAQLQALGVAVLGVPADGAHLSLKAALRILAGHGITRLMVEAGGTLLSALWREDLIDELHWFRGNVILGQGQDAFPAQFGETLASLARLPPATSVALGPDRYDHIQLHPCLPAS